jgi:hypothetical protein
MLVIHIGPRKTATTYLQSNFYRNRKELLAKGWLYPVVSTGLQNAHHAVAGALGEIRSGRGQLARSIARAGKSARARNAGILISSEGFANATPEDFLMLGERFGQQEVVVVYTLRDPLDLFVSNWNETVKVGKTASLGDYAARHLANPLRSRVVNPLMRLKPILETPDLGLVVLNFEELKRTRADIYTAFGRHVLGLEDLKPAQDKPRNESFPAEINDFLRLLSRRLDYDPKEAEFLFARQFARTHTPAEIAQIAASVRRAGAGARTDIVFDRNQPWLAALEVDLLQTLGDRLVPPPTSATLFGRGVVESVSYDIDALAADPEVRDLVDRSGTRVRKARRRWGRSPIVGAWRQFRRLFSV